MSGFILKTNQAAVILKNPVIRPQIMKRSFALMLSAAATAILLVMGVGVYWAAQIVAEQAQPVTHAQSETQPADVVSTTENTETSDAGGNANLVTQYQEREAHYQQLIAEANAKILQASADNKAVATKLAEAQKAFTTIVNNPKPTEPVAQSYPVTPEMATHLAQSLAKGAALKREPELVTYQSLVAYKVTLEAGVVIVDANTDALLYAGRRDPESGSE